MLPAVASSALTSAPARQLGSIKPDIRIYYDSTNNTVRKFREDLAEVLHNGRRTADRNGSLPPPFVRMVDSKPLAPVMGDLEALRRKVRSIHASFVG
jgi:hypothetical protein